MCQLFSAPVLNSTAISTDDTDNETPIVSWQESYLYNVVKCFTIFYKIQLLQFLYCGAFELENWVCKQYHCIHRFDEHRDACFRDLNPLWSSSIAGTHPSETGTRTLPSRARGGGLFLSMSLVHSRNQRYIKARKRWLIFLYYCTIICKLMDANSVK